MSTKGTWNCLGIRIAYIHIRIKRDPPVTLNSSFLNSQNIYCIVFWNDRKLKNFRGSSTRLLLPFCIHQGSVVKQNSNLEPLFPLLLSSYLFLCGAGRHDAWAFTDQSKRLRPRSHRTQRCSQSVSRYRRQTKLCSYSMHNHTRKHLRNNVTMGIFYDFPTHLWPCHISEWWQRKIQTRPSVTWDALRDAPRTVWTGPYTSQSRDLSSRVFLEAFEDIRSLQSIVLCQLKAAKPPVEAFWPWGYQHEKWLFFTQCTLWYTCTAVS